MDALRRPEGRPRVRARARVAARAGSGTALVVALGLGLASGWVAGPAWATGTTGPDGVVRGPVRGDPALVGDLSVFVRDLDLTVESVSGDFGVRSGPQQTTVTVSADVLFAFDKADLSPAAQAQLAQVVAELRAGHASGQVVVGGHADHLGDAAYNQALSLRRAQAVVAALQPLLSGVGVTLVAQGFGSTRPLVKETKPDGSDDPAARARNRRVTVTFTHPAR
jgi:outer membrane protein OmpA-like peptidoglycan-associated protein